MASVTKVSPKHQTRTTAAPIRSGETNLLPIAHASPYPIERAACTDPVVKRCRVDGPDGREELPPQVPLPELLRRAGIKFSGETSAVVTSGGGLATTAPTWELARDVTKIIREDLPAVLFDRSAKPRPCGLLCKLSAAGMLICDVLGLPLTPFVLAEPIGKEAARMAGKITAEVKRAKKAGERRGIDVQKAEADFLRRRIKLPLPTPADIAKAWRLLEKEAAKAATASPPPAPTPQPTPPQPLPPQLPLPSPPADAAPAAVADAAVARAEPDLRQPTAMTTAPGKLQVEFATSEFINELKHSAVVGLAINAALRLEHHIPAPLDDVSVPSEVSETDSDEDDDAAQATQDYKRALRRLAKAYPDKKFCRENPLDTTLTAAEVHTVQCTCGKGCVRDWPWLLQPDTHGFCDCLAVFHRRCEWFETSVGGGLDPCARYALLPLHAQPQKELAAGTLVHY